MPFKSFPLYEKLKRKIRSRFLSAIDDTVFQFALYPSYWHYTRSKKKISDNAPEGNSLRYLGQIPNYGAGIGHQLSNWNAAYYFSRLYKLKFAHFPFSNAKWEHILGFGEHQADGREILANNAFKKVRLPRFNSEKPEQVLLIQKIVQSYYGEKILFLAELDQSYMRQCDTADDLSIFFFAASARQNDKLLFNTSNLNIALHIRRGDIVSMKSTNAGTREQRWLDNNYYSTVLKKTLSLLPVNERPAVYLFSQGEKSDFPEFQEFDNIHYCLGMNAYDSFLHMVYADVLISSKSSFSYKPALLSKGIKICPKNFWHSYPAGNFILVDDEASFSSEQLIAAYERFEHKRYKSADTACNE